MIKELQKLGLTKNESTVYIKLLGLGSTTAGKIIKETTLHRNIVYDNLENLGNKGLVSFVNTKGIKHFSTTPPDELKNYIQKKKKQILDQENIAKEILPQIKKLRNTKKPSTEASIYKGTKAAKLIFEEFTKNTEEELLILGTGKMKEFMPLYYDQWNLKVKLNKTKVRAIVNQKSKQNWKTPYEIRYLKEKETAPAAIAVKGSIIINILWSESPTIIRIENKDLADSYKTHFNYLWSKATK